MVCHRPGILQKIGRECTNEHLIFILHVEVTRVIKKNYAVFLATSVFRIFNKLNIYSIPSFPGNILGRIIFRCIDRCIVSSIASVVPKSILITYTGLVFSKKNFQNFIYILENHCQRLSKLFTQTSVANIMHIIINKQIKIFLVCIILYHFVGVNLKFLL